MSVQVDVSIDVRVQEVPPVGWSGGRATSSRRGRCRGGARTARGLERGVVQQRFGARVVGGSRSPLWFPLSRDLEELQEGWNRPEASRRACTGPGRDRGAGGEGAPTGTERRPLGLSHSLASRRYPEGRRPRVVQKTDLRPQRTGPTQRTKSRERRVRPASYPHPTRAPS